MDGRLATSVKPIPRSSKEASIVGGCGSFYQARFAKGPPEEVAGSGVVVALGRGVAAGVDAYENEVEARAEEVWEGVNGVSGMLQGVANRLILGMKYLDNVEEAMVSDSSSKSENTSQESSPDKSSSQTESIPNKPPRGKPLSGKRGL